MTDALERIWAVPERNCTVYMSGNSPITAQDGPFTHHRHGEASEYVRADLVEVMEAENQRLREALLSTAASLAAAVGLLERGGKAVKKEAPSDKMFDQMLADYRKSLGDARAALRSTEETYHD